VNVIGLDPGSSESSVVELAPDGQVTNRYSGANVHVREWLRAARLFDSGGLVTLAVEYMRPRGMPTAQEEIDTCVELGRMIEAWGGSWKPVSRMQAKMHVCGRANATDANIRQGLIDFYGGEKAIGGKKCQRCHGQGWRGRDRAPCADCSGTAWRIPPGPLAGLTGDEWAALAVAVTFQGRTSA